MYALSYRTVQLTIQSSLFMLLQRACLHLLYLLDGVFFLNELDAVMTWFVPAFILSPFPSRNQHVTVLGSPEFQGRPATVEPWPGRAQKRAAQLTTESRSLRAAVGRALLDVSGPANGCPLAAPRHRHPMIRSPRPCGVLVNGFASTLPSLSRVAQSCLLS